jgi:hypothetical protein
LLRVLVRALIAPPPSLMRRHVYELD